MSTRTCYRFIRPADGEYTSPDVVTVYKHYDGYPEGAYEFIKNALSMAWPLPRFETDEFAAAFVAANKGDGGGDIRLVPYEGMDAHARFAADTEYLYDVTTKGGALYITAWEIDHGDWKATTAPVLTQIFAGTLDEMGSITISITI